MTTNMAALRTVLKNVSLRGVTAGRICSSTLGSGRDLRRWWKTSSMDDKRFFTTISARWTKYPRFGLGPWALAHRRIIALENRRLRY